MKRAFSVVMGGMVLWASTECAAKQRGLFDIIVDVAGYVYESGYASYAADVDYLLSDIVHEMRPFSTFFSPVHDLQLADMHRAFIIIDHEWRHFLYEHERAYGLFITDMINLRAHLTNVLHALRHARVSSRILYDYELEAILDYLEEIVYEMRRPVLYGDSILRITTYFGSITYLINRL